MNELERRLTDAMAARAGEVEPQDEHEALEHITRRIDMRSHRGLTVIGIAAAVFVAIGAFALLRGGDDKKQQVNVSSGASTTTTATTTPASVIPSGPEPVWPFASMNRTFATPAEAAKSFAVDYLGMTKARLGATNGNDVELFVNERGNARTLVHTEDRGARGWVVVGSDADQIKVDTPKPHDALTSSLSLQGQSVAFEAQVGVELRPFGSLTPVAQSYVMGGSSEMQPFGGSIDVPATDQPLVLIMFEGDASGEQTYTKATVIPLDAAGASEPTEFVGLNQDAELLHFDASGHIQKTIASGVVEYAYSPTTRLVAYTHTGGVCGIDFIGLDGGQAPARVENAIAPVFSPGGDKLAFTVCGDRHVAVRTLATGEQVDSVPDFVPTLPDQTGTLATLRGRFGTVAFYNGRSISSYNPADGKVVELLQPAAEPHSLDADESGRFLLWVDKNHDVWKWSGGEPVKVATGFNSAAW